MTDGTKGEATGDKVVEGKRNRGTKGDKEPGANTGRAKRPQVRGKVSKAFPGKGPGKPIAGKKSGGEPGDDRLTVGAYNIMWTEYCQHQSVSKCAKAVGIRYETARRYILGKGRPEDGLMPIRARYLEAMAEAQEEQEQTLAEWQRDQVKDMKRIVSLHMAEFALIQKHATQRIKRYEDALRKEPLALPELEVSMDRLSQSMDRMIRLTEHLMGGSDLKIEHKQENMFATWTDEEKLLYATKGILPEHAR